MTPGPGGTLTATVPCEKDSLRYQLLGVLAGGDPVCGTDADTLVVDRGRPLFENRSSSFVSIKKSNRQAVRLVFDPGRLPRGRTSSTCTFADSLGTVARIAAVHEDVQRRARRTDAYIVFRARGGAPDSFRWDASADLKDLLVRIDQERDPVVRGFLELKCVQLAPRDLDSTRARRILKEIFPESPLWSLLWGGPENTFHEIARAASDAGAVRAYAERVVDVHPDSSVRAAFLYELLSEAHGSGHVQRAGQYYTRMMAEFSATTLGKRSRKEFGTGRMIVKGNTVPDIAFASVDDPTRRHRAADFRGRHLLIDFWATWCKPCVDELWYLRVAHDKYEGLLILSVSFDRERENIRRFHAKGQARRWLSAFEPLGFSSEAARAFEIAGIPRLVLVDPKGKIVALDDELRRERLDKTLAAVLSPWRTHSPR